MLALAAFSMKSRSCFLIGCAGSPTRTSRETVPSSCRWRVVVVCAKAAAGANAARQAIAAESRNRIREFRGLVFIARLCADIGFGSRLPHAGVAHPLRPGLFPDGRYGARP